MRLSGRVGGNSAPRDAPSATVLVAEKLVPEAGIEPARVLPRGILSPVRLPISPLRQQENRSRKLWHSDAMNYPTIEDAIGKTPLAVLQRIGAAENAQRGNVILGKLEGNNPAGSVKDRPALSMIK